MPDAFTLLELLVVVAIIGLLAGLLLPALANARRKSHESACLSNLRQLSLAATMYADECGSYPPAWINSTARWMDLLKPYVPKKSGAYVCLSDTQKIPLPWDPTITMSFGINTFNFAGNRWCFWYGVKLRDVVRPAGTILYADCTPGKYYAGGGSTFTDPVVDVHYRHPNQSFNAVYCDGHAERKTKTQRSDWDASQ
ncbi:MAG: hypothetical protein PCFJNLEI_03821 [Verrucomicrobiae bacterium]|nr:hypothetical protein [Verrucomicrobiae bacterium]